MTRVKYQPRPQSRTSVIASPHPSGGRGFAYSHKFCQAVHVRHLIGGDDASIQQLCLLHLYPAKITEWHWFGGGNISRLQWYGHLCCFVRTGNRKETVMRGHGKFMLMIDRVCFPKARQSHVNALFPMLWDVNNSSIHRKSHGWKIALVYQKKRISNSKKSIASAKFASSLDLLEFALPSWNCQHLLK